MQEGSFHQGQKQRTRQNEIISEYIITVAAGCLLETLHNLFIYLFLQCNQFVGIVKKNADCNLETCFFRPGQSMIVLFNLTRKNI